MAVKKYKPIKIDFKQPTLPTPYDPAKQTEGYKKRIEGSGLDVDKALDKRNFLEKVLNLTPDQNALFDVFEVIERPQRAFFGGVKAAQEGGDILEGIKSGITGKDVVQFKELMHNMGMADSGKEFGADDVVGFLGEVFADPIDLAIWGGATLAAPATAGGSLLAAGAVTAAKAAGATKDVLNVMDAASDVNKAYKAAKSAGASSDVLKAIKQAKKAPIGKLSIKTVGAAEPEALAEYALKNGGATVKAGKIIEPSIGFSVATDKASEQVFNSLDEIKDVITKGGHQDYGVWKDGDKWYLDVSSKHVLDPKEAYKIGKSADQLSVMDWAKKGTDGQYRAVDDLVKDFAPKNISTLQLGARGVKKGIKGVAKLTDSGINTILPKIDKMMEAGQLARKELNPLAKTIKLVDSYKDIKERVVGIFNVAKALPPGVWNSIRKAGGDEALTLKRFGHMADDVASKIDNLATEMGADSKKVGKDMLDYAEWRKTKNAGESTSVQDLFYKGLDDSGKGAIDPATVKTIKKALADIGEEFPDLNVKFSRLYGKMTLSNGTVGYFLKEPDLLKKMLDNTAGMSDELAAKLSNKIKAPSFRSADEEAYFEALGMNKQFTDLVDYASNVQKQMGADLNKVFGILERDSEGYFRHAITAERKALPDNMRAMSEAKSQFKGNMSTFNGREYNMSVKEANMIASDNLKFLKENNLLDDKQLEFWADKENMKVFEETLQASMADFIEYAPKFAKTHKMMDEVLVKSFMNDTGLVRKLEGNVKAPDGFQKVTADELKAKLKSMVKNIDSPAMEQVIKDLPSGHMAIESNIFDAIGRLDNPKEVNRLVTYLDSVNDIFKKTKLLSPGFQMRNVVGNASNIFLSGAGIGVLGDMKYAHKVMKNGDALLKKSISNAGSLTAKETKMLGFYEEFVQNGFHDIAGQVWDMTPDIAKKYGLKSQPVRDAAKWVMRKNQAMNQWADERYRLALFMYAKKNPEIVKRAGLAADDAAGLVRRVLFDPKDLSVAEKAVAKRMVPFYTFAKKNLAFQMQNVLDNPTKYKRLKKTIEQIWDVQGLDVKEVEDYKRENFWIPIATKGKDGEYKAIKVNLPIGDLADFMGNPLQKVVSSVSPVLRSPFELTMNKQAFTQRPISEFKGQKGFMIPEIGRKAEYLLSQSGLDVPASLGFDIARTAKGVASGEVNGVGDIMQGALGRSIMSEGNVANAQRSKAYEGLTQVQELMKYYKQEGVDILTLAEIENKNPALSSLEARLKELSRK